jgi:DNA topoisomerase-1
LSNTLLNKNFSNFSDEKKLAEFTRVNTEIALICNHRSAVNPEKREKLDAAIAEIEALEAPTAKQKAKREKLLRDKMTLGVSLTTSKMNYIDPRLVYAWCEKNEIKPSLIYSKALLEATAWANTEEHMSAFYV